MGIQTSLLDIVLQYSNNEIVADFKALVVNFILRFIYFSPLLNYPPVCFPYGPLLSRPFLLEAAAEPQVAQILPEAVETTIVCRRGVVVER